MSERVNNSVSLSTQDLINQERRREEQRRISAIGFFNLISYPMRPVIERIYDTANQTITIPSDSDVMPDPICKPSRDILNEC